MTKLQDRVLVPWGPSSISAVAELVFLAKQDYSLNSSLQSDMWQLSYINIKATISLDQTCSKNTTIVNLFPPDMAFNYDKYHQLEKVHNSVKIISHFF